MLFQSNNLAHSLTHIRMPWKTSLFFGVCNQAHNANCLSKYALTVNVKFNYRLEVIFESRSCYSWIIEAFQWSDKKQSFDPELLCIILFTLFKSLYSYFPPTHHDLQSIKRKSSQFFSQQNQTTLNLLAQVPL